MKKKLLALLLFYLLFSPGEGHACGQDLEALKDSAASLYDSLSNAEDEERRIELDSVLNERISEMLQCEGSFRKDLGELGERIGILTAPDSSFRLFHWNLAHDNGTHTYSGHLLHRNMDGRITHHELRSFQSASKRSKEGGGARKEELERTILEPGTWIPALYYRIIPKEAKGIRFYTLLGWEGKDSYSTRKTIEVLRFEKDGTPRFGLPAFKEEEEGAKKKKELRRNDRLDRFDIERRKGKKGDDANKGPIPKQRIIFEFTNDAVMTLRYEEKKDRIVFNQLVPERPDLKGIYQFYSPDLVFDAFQWKEEGYWQYVEEVEPENKKGDRRPWNDPEE